MISCKECIHTKTRNGTECIHNNITPQFMDKYNWDPHKLALNCRYFKKDYAESVDIVTECFNCGKEMTTNEEWFYVKIHEIKKPVCSLECKKEAQKRINKKLEEVDESNINTFDDFFD